MSNENQSPAGRAPTPAAKPDPKAQLQAATRKDGILAINPAGDLVRLRPGSIRLAASVDKGTFLEGLKDGWRLATSDDLKAKKADAAEGEKENPRGTPSPKASGS